MDELDIRILRELFGTEAAPPLSSDFRTSFRTVARKLGVDEVTVRNRVKKLQLSGFFRGWRCMLNPTLVGLSVAELWLDVLPPSSKADVVKKIRLIHNVGDIISHVGSSLALILLYDSQQALRNVTELVTRIANSENTITLKMPLPRCDIRLSQADLTLVRSIQKFPQRSYLSVAAELGLSNKTVKRRLARLIEGRVLFFLPSLDPKGLRGVTMADLLVFYTSPESKKKADDAIMSRTREYLVFADLHDLEHGFFNLAIPNVAIAQEILEWVKQQPGVRNPRVDLVQERFEESDFMEEVLQRIELQATALRA